MRINNFIGENRRRKQINSILRTFAEAMYHAKDKEILPLILDMMLYVNPNPIPNFAIACLSTLETLLIVSQIFVVYILILVVVVVVVDVDVVNE